MLQLAALVIVATVMVHITAVQVLVILEQVGVTVQDGRQEAEEMEELVDLVAVDQIMVERELAGQVTVEMQLLIQVIKEAHQKLVIGSVA